MGKVVISDVVYRVPEANLIRDRNRPKICLQNCSLVNRTCFSSCRYLTCAPNPPTTGILTSCTSPITFVRAVAGRLAPESDFFFSLGISSLLIAHHLFSLSFSFSSRSVHPTIYLRSHVVYASSTSRSAESKGGGSDHLLTQQRQAPPPSPPSWAPPQRASDPGPRTLLHALFR